MERLGLLIYWIICSLTALIGYHKHHSVFWAIVDFFLTPLVWVKWLIKKEISLTIIKEALDFLIK